MNRYKKLFDFIFELELDKQIIKYIDPTTSPKMFNLFRNKRFVSQQEYEEVMKKVYKAFKRKIKKEYLSNILLFSSNIQEHPIYYGIAPNLFDQLVNEITLITVEINIDEADHIRVNLINPTTGEIKQSEWKSSE